MSARALDEPEVFASPDLDSSLDFNVDLASNTRLRSVALQSSGYGGALFANWALTILKSIHSRCLEEVTLHWRWFADRNLNPRQDRILCTAMDEELARHASTLRRVNVTYEAARHRTEWGLLENSFPRCLALGVLHVEEIPHEGFGGPKQLKVRL